MQPERVFSEFYGGFRDLWIMPFLWRHLVVSVLGTEDVVVKVECLKSQNGISRGGNSAPDKNPLLPLGSGKQGSTLDSSVEPNPEQLRIQKRRVLKHDNNLGRLW
jgi:hypothetical protein